MKLPSTSSNSRRRSGVLLLECLVYIVVFAILTGAGMAAFYCCWSHSKAMIYATDDIGSALRAGERWRADVRGATGKISIETGAGGETVRIPKAGGEIFYRFENGELRRGISSKKVSALRLARVKASEMKADPRGAVSAWRWELELTPRRPEMRLPLLFTFEAAQTKP
jgi:hypothetical protein